MSPFQPLDGRRPRAVLCAALLLALLAVQATGALAQTTQPPAAGAASPDAAPAAVVAPAVRALLAPDPADWLPALDRLRERPAEARQMLLAALRSDQTLPLRWRLAHHLGEFGLQEDIPLVLEFLGSAEEPRELRALRGTARALYRPVRAPDEYPLLVEEFAFLQTGAPVPHAAKVVGKLVISEETIMAYHQQGLAPNLIEKMMRFRGHAFTNRDEVVKAVRPSFGRGEWNSNWETLLAVLSPAPERYELAGVLRLRLYNPNPRPILAEAGFDAWYGRFVDQPLPLLIYLPGQQSASQDVEVRLIGRRGTHPLRIDLRLRDAGGPRYALSQTILLQP
ncbi:MAG: hypothetical protein HY342_01495 [Candidatus Lambdaproteobacteria bacterium]|nr:hypothetical protein [Candidatus Lambdaproteobacteria bacterium]